MCVLSEVDLFRVVNRFLSLLILSHLRFRHLLLFQYNPDQLVFGTTLEIVWVVLVFSFQNYVVFALEVLVFDVFNNLFILLVFFHYYYHI